MAHGCTSPVRFCQTSTELSRRTLADSCCSVAAVVQDNCDRTVSFNSDCCSRRESASHALNLSKQTPLPALGTTPRYSRCTCRASGSVTCARSSDQMMISSNSRSENMQNRPLPMTPRENSKRYQNDSPFCEAKPDSRYEPCQENTQSVEETASDPLKQVPWFHRSVTRERVLEVLSKEDIGAFVIRESSTQIGCFALSVKVPKFDNPAGIAHFLIIRTANGVRMKGLDKEWSSLSALVVHHTIMPELLPCTLKLPSQAASRSLRQGSSSNSNVNTMSSTSSSNKSSLSGTSSSNKSSLSGTNNSSLNNISSSLHSSQSTRSLRASLEFNCSNSDPDKMSTRVKHIQIH